MKYIDLIPHLYGEFKDGKLTGGHLYTGMLKRWKKNLVVEENNISQNSVWAAQWKLKNKIAQPKQSTFFPASWTADELKEQLLNSSPIGNSGDRELPCGITVQKKGDTFYPLKKNE